MKDLTLCIRRSCITTASDSVPIQSCCWHSRRHARTHARMHACTHACMHACTHARTLNTRTLVCARTAVHACNAAQRMHARTDEQQSGGGLAVPRFKGSSVEFCASTYTLHVVLSCDVVKVELTTPSCEPIQLAVEPSIEHSIEHGIDHSMRHSVHHSIQHSIEQSV